MTYYRFPYQTLSGHGEQPLIDPLTYHDLSMVKTSMYINLKITLFSHQKTNLS